MKRTLRPRSFILHGDWVHRHTDLKTKT